MLKNVGFGVAGVVGVSLLGYLGYKGIKKFKGKKENISKVDKDLIRNEFTDEDLKQIIKDEEKLIQDLKNLGYRKCFIKELEDALQIKKDLLNTAF
jgi:hypothetical protein